MNSSVFLRFHLTNGEWTGNANLTDCGEKILIEARESGSGLKQDYTIDWDLRKPKFEIIALRPYFNSETEQVQILIESAGISTGIVNIELVALKGDLGKVDTTTLTAPAANIDTIVNIPLPESWKTNVKVISVKATRQIDENDKSRVLTLYLPNLDKSVLSKTLLTINNPKVNYVYNDVIDVKITRVNNLLYKFLIVCSSNIPQWIEDDGNSTILKIKISQKMDGTCYLAALMTEKTTTNSRNVFSDVILFRVRNFCESCNVQINKIDSHGMRKPLASPHDSVEPRDTVELAFTGSPFSLVIYRVIDDRLNHIENINMAEESEDYDYLFTFSKKTSGINIFSDGDWKGITDRIIDACCENLGSFFDGSDQKSRISKECLNKLNGCPSIDQLNAPLRVRNGGLPITVSTHQRKTLLVEQRVDDVSVPQEENKNSRKIFPETWLFDSIILPSNGSGTITAEVPDSITTWEVGSQFWAKGKLSLYRAKTERIYTKKSIFLEFDLPKHVYVNEIISPLITVATSSSQNQKGSRDNKMVLCLSKLPRHVCGDQGVDGKKGEAYYNRIDLTGKQSDAKYVMLNFLTAGAFNVTVTLQWHSCESNAELIDAVTRLVVVQKRPDTRTYEEAHTINPEKESSANMDRTIITFSDKKSATEPDTMHTLIRSDLEDSDTVYSFKLTISEFLQPERKIVREYEDRMPRTLTSVIKDFASTLYDFKTISLEKNEDKTELKQRVNSLENRLMGFSDCSSDGKPCGYNFFGPPVDSKSYSILLTAIATSLLCSADAEKSRVNGSLQTVMKYIPRLNDTDFNADLSDIIDIENVEDKKFIIVSFLFRAIKDCRNYTMNSISLRTR
ncbi:unnamed protein product [Caenorhabditis angaria]|uniref:Alpha-2-macroglobulin domain-containing protein n=1 Tax=Caenorhabditis angaria TaxID=860376 RepID=A0A9P1IZW6_9PELO|nr:unnamed protein product [Caenorhabditis angaria]